MSEGIPYADIVILALIAGFVLLRLRSTLGRKPDGEDDFLRRLQPMADTGGIVQIDRVPKSKPKEEADSYLAALKDGETKSALQSIKAKDPQFSATQFLTGAKFAFEMVHDGFAKGDKSPLKMLLSEAIFKAFSDEIDTRADQETRTETTLVSVAPRDIAKASLTGNTARLTVTFISEQISIVRNKKSEIVEGNPSETHQVEDEWSFERDVTSKNPNWKIVEI